MPVQVVQFHRVPPTPRCAPACLFLSHATLNPPAPKVPRRDSLGAVPTPAGGSIFEQSRARTGLVVSVVSALRISAQRRQSMAATWTRQRAQLRPKLHIGSRGVDESMTRTAKFDPSCHGFPGITRPEANRISLDANAACWKLSHINYKVSGVYYVLYILD